MNKYSFFYLYIYIMTELYEKQKDAIKKYHAKNPEKLKEARLRWYAKKKIEKEKLLMKALIEKYI